MIGCSALVHKTELQGRPPEEGLVASGRQTLEVCGQALALLHLLRIEVLIQADAGSSESTGCLECCMSQSLAATYINSTSTALGLS